MSLVVIIHVAILLQSTSKKYIGNHDFFLLNFSGLISVLNKVDRESNPSGYSLIVTARDHGYPVFQFSTATVDIAVSDINDNAPKFDKFTYSAEVREDSDINKVVAAVHAVDNDEGLAGEIVYSITGVYIVHLVKRASFSSDGIFLFAAKWIYV